MATRPHLRTVLIVTGAASATVAGATGIGVRAGLTSPGVALIVAALASVTIAVTGAATVVTLQKSALDLLRDPEATDNLVRVINAIREDPVAPSDPETQDVDEPMDGRPRRFIFVMRRGATAWLREGPPARELPVPAADRPTAED